MNVDLCALLWLTARTGHGQRQPDRAAAGRGIPIITALPDDPLFRQIYTFLADLKVVWQAKNISGGLPMVGVHDLAPLNAGSQRRWLLLLLQAASRVS
jgi:hypothetical protein